MLTELHEKVATSEPAAENYESITTQDNSGPGSRPTYEALQMSRRWLEIFYNELIYVTSL